MESITEFKKRVKSYDVRYITVVDPLSSHLKAMVYHDGSIKYSASCHEDKVSIFCNKGDIQLIRKHLEGIIKDKLAKELWMNSLAKATPDDICDVS